MRRKYTQSSSHLFLSTKSSPSSLYSISLSSSLLLIRSSSSTTLPAGEWERLGTKKIDKKFTPPPPIFGFKTLKPEEEEKMKKIQQEQREREQAKAAGKLDRSRFSGPSRGEAAVFGGQSDSSIFNERPFYSAEHGKVIKYEKVGVWDVLAENIAMANSSATSATASTASLINDPNVVAAAASVAEILSSSSASSSSNNAAAAFKPPTSLSSSSSPTVNLASQQEFRNPLNINVNNDREDTNGDYYNSNSHFVRSLRTIGALRNPEDIILVFRPFLQKTGRIDFQDIPPYLVRQLIGHDGFGEEPKLAVVQQQRKENKTQEKQENNDNDQKEVATKNSNNSSASSSLLVVDEDILEAITRVVLPTGVLAIDKKRKCIKMKPGVAQLAARIDATICELNGGTLKKVAFSAVYHLLTGTEKAFVRDVGGLNRIALCFPLQFTLPKDLLGVQKTTVTIVNKKDSNNVTAADLLNNNSSNNQPSSTIEDEIRISAQQQNVYQSGVAKFKESEKQRLARMTTGESLVKEGESIFANADEED